MNHFFLWAGPRSEVERSGHQLISRYKSVDSLCFSQGHGWNISYGCQRGGLGAFHDDRGRTIAGASRRQLLWFGHAWSKSHGAQPCFRLIQESPDNLSIIKLAECIRENTDGVYSFALIDESSQMLAVASDLLVSFHVYFRYFPEGIALSNSSALFAALKPLNDLDPLGIQEFCSNAVANEDRTIW